MKKFQRKPIRLKEYDYTQPGYYFLTLCTHNKQKLFAEERSGKLIAYPYHPENIIHEEIEKIPTRYPGVYIDKYVVMADHFHCILIIEKEESYNLSDIVKDFKQRVVHAYTQGVKEAGYKRYKDRFWQKSYIDHVIRNEESLYEIRKYIIENPYRLYLDVMGYHE